MFVVGGLMYLFFVKVLSHSKGNFSVLMTFGYLGQHEMVETVAPSSYNAEITLSEKFVQCLTHRSIKAFVNKDIKGLEE